jgi:hypothetical protein
MSSFRACLTDLETFYLDIVGNIQWTAALNEAIEEIAEFFAKCFAAIGGSGSWQENLLSAVYIPINISTFQAHKIGNQIASFYIGSIPCTLPSGSYAYEIDSSGVYLSCKRTVSIPWSTQATTYPYLKNPRWNVLQAIMPGAYYDIDTATVAEMSVYICGSGAYPDELAVFKFNDEASAKVGAESVKSRLDSQTAIYKDYTPAEMYKLDEAVIITEGNWVAFAACADNAKAKEIIESMI